MASMRATSMKKCVPYGINSAEGVNDKNVVYVKNKSVKLRKAR